MLLKSLKTNCVQRQSVQNNVIYMYSERTSDPRIFQRKIKTNIEIYMYVHLVKRCHNFKSCLEVTYLQFSLINLILNIGLYIARKNTE